MKNCEIVFFKVEDKIYLVIWYFLDVEVLNKEFG